MSGGISRLSVSLNDETEDLIEKLQDELGTSKAEVVRRAVKLFDAVGGKDGPDDHCLKVYVDLLSKGGHVVVDRDIWRLLSREIEGGSESLWEGVREVGEHHWDQMADKGVEDPEEVLEYVEKDNLYELRKESENSFTLLLRVPESRELVEEFLEGIFGKSPHSFEIDSSQGKVMVRFPDSN